MHEVPSVERAQPCVSTRITGAHEPPEHVRSVQVRDCVPVVPHVPENPPHAPKPGHDVVPHDIPSVDVRVQACISVESLGTQLFDAQWNVRTVRLCVPLVAQLLPKLHAP